MKKLALILIAFMSIAMMACAQTQNKEQKQETKETKEMKTLVAYFSASGVTEGVAKKLAEVAKADLYEITPVERYTDADLDWRDPNSRSSVEMKDPTARTPITDMDGNLPHYDVIFVGFPIWWYTCPRIINTFLEVNNFEGVTLVPFATSGGSSIDKSCQDLKEQYPNYKFAQGKLLNSFNTEEVQKWIDAAK